MDTQATKARIATQIDEWQRDLKTLKAKADVATGNAKVEYQERMGKLEEELNDFKIRAAEGRDSSDDKLESTKDDLALRWEEWKVGAKRAWHDLTDGEHD